MFILQENPIDPIKAKSSFSDPNNGALVTFEGLVRADQIKDTQVNSLLYIADTPLCIKEGQKIIQETISQFPIQHALCIQRIGKLNVGETAIWVGVWAGHREEAYNASRYIIEEVKQRLHIWKKEFLTNGSAVWAYGAQTPVIK